MSTEKQKFNGSENNENKIADEAERFLNERQVLGGAALNSLDPTDRAVVEHYAKQRGLTPEEVAVDYKPIEEKNNHDPELAERFKEVVGDVNPHQEGPIFDDEDSRRGAVEGFEELLKHEDDKKEFDTFNLPPESPDDQDRKK